MGMVAEDQAAGVWGVGDREVVASAEGGTVAVATEEAGPVEAERAHATVGGGGVDVVKVVEQTAARGQQ